MARPSIPAASAASSFASFSPPPDAVSTSAVESVRNRGESLDRRAELRSALNTGAIAGAVVSLFPVAFFLVAPLAGYFGVRSYRRRGGMRESSAGAGFKFGALVGLFASPIFAVLRVAQIVATGGQGELRKAMVENLRQAAASSPDPRAHQFADYIVSPQGIAVLIIFGLVCVCLAFVLLAGMGGAISGGLSRRKGR